MPLPFGSQYLYQHYAATGWDPDAQYPQLTKPSRALLDFGFLPGVHFSLSQAPVPQFANSASLSALTGPLVEDVDAAAGTTTSEGTATGTMKGSLAYMASSSGAVHVRSSRDASVADVVERFRLPALPDVKGKGKASSRASSLSGSSRRRAHPRQQKGTRCSTVASTCPRTGWTRCIRSA